MFPLMASGDVGATVRTAQERYPGAKLTGAGGGGSIRWRHSTDHFDRFLLSVAKSGARISRNEPSRTASIAGIVARR